MQDEVHLQMETVLAEIAAHILLDALAEWVTLMN